MQTLILHHYDGSPFSEKLRLILGYKNLDWLSVKLPVIMPKPELTALTGGYRKTPVVQVGADVYCDSALIASLLEAREPTPTLFPKDAALAPLLAQWADSTLLWTVIPYAMQPAGREHVFKGVPAEALGRLRGRPRSVHRRHAAPERYRRRCQPGWLSGDAAGRSWPTAARICSAARHRSPISRSRTACGTCAGPGRWPRSSNAIRS